MQQGQADITEKCIACGKQEYTICDRWDCPFLLEKEAKQKEIDKQVGDMIIRYITMGIF